MTVITLSKVGFGEIAPMSDAAKLFTIFFIVISLSVFAYGLKEMTQYFLTENIFEKIKQKKNEQNDRFFKRPYVDLW
ncbi:MAG: two pore domain potassium channel family protein [Flavobacteriaceae bacterium]|jgi:voltage-gated potassium channel|nr:two pore domain potassium channel family protein [Flavobacteriaceae bacterium]